MCPNLYFNNLILSILNKWINFFVECLKYESLQNQHPGALTDFFKKNNEIHGHNTRLHELLRKPLGKTNVQKCTVTDKGLDIIYNSLTDDIRERTFIMGEEVEWNSDSTFVIFYIYPM